MKATLATKPSATRTGCSRSSGTATASRRSSRDGKARLCTRNGNDAETYFPRLLDAADVDRRPARRSSTARSSRSTSAAARTSGCSRSAARAGRARPVLVYQAFDLLYLDGRSLLDVPLEERKRLLRSVARGRPDASGSRPTRGRGQGVLRGRHGAGPGGDRRQASPLPLRARPARHAWLKIKVRPEQELVVGGWTPGEGTRRSSGRSSSASTRTASCSSPARSAPGSTRRTRQGAPRAARRPGDGRAAVRPAAPAGLPGPLGRRPRAASAGSGRSSSSARSSAAGRRDGLVRQTAFKGLERGRDPREVVRERAVDPARGGSRGR